MDGVVLFDRFMQGGRFPEVTEIQQLIRDNVPVEVVETGVGHTDDSQLEETGDDDNDDDILDDDEAMEARKYFGVM